MQNGSSLFGRTLPMLGLVHHTIGVLHWSVWLGTRFQIVSIRSACVFPVTLNLSKLLTVGFFCILWVFSWLLCFLRVCFFVWADLILAGPLPWPCGPSGPLAVTVARPSASYCPGLVGQGAMVDPLDPSQTPAPHQTPGQLLRPPNLHSTARWAPGHTVGPLRVDTLTQSGSTHTHILSQQHHICSLRLFTNGGHATHMLKWALHTHTHMHTLCVNPFTQSVCMLRCYPQRAIMSGVHRGATPTGGAVFFTNCCFIYSLACESFQMTLAGLLI